MSYRDDYFDANSSDHGWYTCVSCGKKLRRTDADIDHIIPQYHGGPDSLDNLQCMCRHCNRSKKSRHEVYTRGFSSKYDRNSIRNKRCHR